MGIAYQATFFVALTLLAIVITVFVFAISLLGRAAEVASKEQEKTTKEQKDSTEQHIIEIKSKIDELTKKKHIGEELRELEKTLKKLKKEDKRFEKKLKRIEETPQLLSVKGGIIYSTIPLGVSLVFSGVGWYYPSSATVLSVPISPTAWILALCAIGYGVFRILKSLRAVESVAVASTEEAERRLAQAVKWSLLELEETKKPKLELIFADIKPPFRMIAGSETEINVDIGATKGVARNVVFYLLAPIGFEFPGHTKWLTPPDIKDHIAIAIEIPDIILTDIFHRQTIKIKAPSEAKCYTIHYRLFCEDYSSGYEKFDVVVE